MDHHSKDPIDNALEEVSARPGLRKVILIVALICLASSFLGLFFLVTRLIMPNGFF